MTVALLLACAKGRPTETAFNATVQFADIAWGLRQRTGLEPVEVQLLEAHRLQPNNPEVLWRLARLAVVEGMAASDPAAAAASFADGRATGVTCLERADAWTQALAEEGMAAAMAAAAADRPACAVWAALGWVKWLETVGAEAGAIDLPAVDALLAGTRGVRLRGELRWAEGVLTAIRPEWSGRDLQRARELLEEAVADQPASVARKADLIRLVLVPIGDPAAELVRREALAMAPSGPEDVAAKALLAAGP